MCLKKGKSVDKINNLVTKCFNKIYVFNSSNELLLSGTKLYQEMSSKGSNFLQLGTLKNCLKNLKKDVGNGCIGLIFGSHYIAEEIYKALEISFDADII